MRNYLLLAGTFWLLLTLGCAAVTPAPVASPEPMASTPATAAAGTAPPRKVAKTAETKTDTVATAPLGSSDVPSAPSPNDELAVLVVQAGALVTQINGDSALRCLRPECRIPLPAGTHRVAVGYRNTETRAGSTVTYASMHPRIVEVTLESGHRYSVTASGRYSQKWWIAIEDQTSNKTVYNDREKPQ